jgi:hypothetical protein
MRVPKVYSVNLEIKCEQRVTLAGEARKAGLSRNKGWFHRFLIGRFPQGGRPGSFAIVEQTMKRVGFGNWYSKKVVDEETGEVLRQCDEPLSEHQGRGSARRMKDTE